MNVDSDSSILEHTQQLPDTTKTVRLHINAEYMPNGKPFSSQAPNPVNRDVAEEWCNAVRIAYARQEEQRTEATSRSNPVPVAHGGESAAPEQPGGGGVPAEAVDKAPEETLEETLERRRTSTYKQLIHLRSCRDSALDELEQIKDDIERTSQEVEVIKRMEALLNDPAGGSE